ncbi:endonuclease/exonuclease/phosphatase family protein [Ancylostoma caninum]|uniref:Endonuclease/exonuclease/phosphatase family protein n=1 Tax=Ancylostoma caninum TaxID=29170 RepID=A0A368GS74_ANCCA|nr:endonuclease/exonuclease/phosphatase family protein [Ancylostoma caninum]
MAITNAEESAALSILEGTEWDVNKALNFYFGTGEEDSDDEEAKGDVAASESTRSSYHQNGPVDLTGLEVSLVSWNVDGLDGNSLATRMKAVYKVVSNLNPDFVFLQEVVGRELPTIERLSKLYDIYYSNKDYLYFTAILVSKIFEVDRKEQFQLCMDKIREIISANPNCLLFFGGDLNIRDDEISNVPRGLADAWLAAGADKQTQFTWDTRKNDNKQAFGARTRFDRIFWYGPLSRVKFSLAGQQRIRSCLCFPSDHWAVHCEFS